MPPNNQEVFVGMNRPDWDEFSGKITANVLCSCGTTLTHQGATREHWQLGHFDEPVTISTAAAYRMRLEAEQR